MDTAVEHWAEELGKWGIPQEIVDAAPESPWTFPPDLFARAAEAAVAADAPRSPSFHRAREALSDGGSVLDVGVGGGAASLPLVPPAAHVTGVDQGDELLAAFDEAATALGIPHDLVRGRWPDVAAEAPAADVVVCHHVLYNVGDLEPFVSALSDHARRRVVVELTEQHPMSRFNHLWRALHGIERPAGPTAEDALAAITELGLAATSESWERLGHPSHMSRSETVAFARRRLCVGPDRDPEIDRLLDAGGAQPLPSVVTIWWDV